MVLGGAIPTIILTGDITTATLRDIARSDCQQVAKPVMPDVLLAQISDVMLTARTRETSTADGSGTTLHVVDDDPIIRETTQRLFEAEGWKVVTYPSAEEFLASPRPSAAACLLVDALLPGMDGVALVSQLRSEGSHLPAVMLTGYGDAEMAVAAQKAGVSDLIEKPASAADLLESVRGAIETYEDGRARAESRSAAQTRFSDLTSREREVLARVLEGAPNKIIAHELGISQRTVEVHRASVMRKTGVSSLPELVRLALVADIQSN